MQAYHLSHSPPGLTIEQPSGRFSVRLQVKNFGRTPANVTAVFLTSKVLPQNESLPDIPDYERTDGEKNAFNAFLVTEDEYFSVRVSDVSINDIPEIYARRKKLWLYGYVDYIDQFEQPHRAGYARVYDPALDDRNNYRSDEDFSRRSNLVFIDQSKYSYDCPRKKGKGND